MCHLFAHQPQRGALLVAQIAGAQMLLPLPSRPMVRRCSSSNVRPATSRNYPSRFGKVRRGSGSSAGRPARWTASAFGRFREGRLRLGRRQARRLAGKPGGNYSRRYRRLPPAQSGDPRRIIAYLKELN